MSISKRNSSNSLASILGSIGAVTSCCAIMVSLFFSSLGAMGVTAVTGLQSHPAWVGSIMYFSKPILLVSFILLIWGLRHSTGLTKTIVGFGILFMIANLFVKSPWIAYPGLILIVGGNLIGWIQVRNKKSTDYEHQQNV